MLLEHRKPELPSKPAFMPNICESGEPMPQIPSPTPPHNMMMQMSNSNIRPLYSPAWSSQLPPPAYPLSVNDRVNNNNNWDSALNNNNKKHYSFGHATVRCLIRRPDVGFPKGCRAPRLQRTSSKPVQSRAIRNRPPALWCRWVCHAITMKITRIMRPIMSGFLLATKTQVNRITTHKI